MSIERIIELMPVPDEVIESNGHDWSAMSSAAKCDFPEDYKVFLSTYGTGVVGGFLWVLNPFSSNPNLNIEKAMYFKDAYRYMGERFPADYPHKDDTFFPWAVTDNGNTLVWLTEGLDPNKWQVAIYSSDQGEEELSGLTTCDFLVALLEKRLTSSILPTQFLEGDKEFRAL